MIPQGIILHCSDSDFGCRDVIDRWHRERGWQGIGYHFVINNGDINKNTHIPSLNGAIELGRSLKSLGAHAKGYNDYIGICLIGKQSFTEAQIKAASNLVKDLCLLYNIDYGHVLGHYQVSTKTCPNFDVDLFKKLYLSNKSKIL